MNGGFPKIATQSLVQYSAMVSTSSSPLVGRKVGGKRQIKIRPHLVRNIWLRCFQKLHSKPLVRNTWRPRFQNLQSTFYQRNIWPPRILILKPNFRDDLWGGSMQKTQTKSQRRNMRFIANDARNCLHNATCTNCLCQMLPLFETSRAK